MADTNDLLFNNIFVSNLSPTEEEIAAAHHLVRAIGEGEECCEFVVVPRPPGRRAW
jgi:hypothetical protein